MRRANDQVTSVASDAHTSTHSATRRGGRPPPAGGAVAMATRRGGAGTPAAHHTARRTDFAEMVLYHLAPAPAWAASATSNTPYKPPTFDADGGFTHLTAAPEKLLAVGNTFYRTDPGAWVLIELKDAPAGGDVKWEAAAPVGETPPAADFAGETFPHLYGPILQADVLRVLPVTRGSDGEFLGVEGVC